MSKRSKRARQRARGKQRALALLTRRRENQGGDVAKPPPLTAAEKARLAREQVIAKLKEDVRCADVWYEEHGLVFQTDWILIPVNGHILKTARWRVFLPESQGLRLEIECLQCGARDQRQRPMYYTEASSAFCFGSRAKFLHQLLSDRQILAAAYLILDSLGHVNHTDVTVAVGRYGCAEACLVCSPKVSDTQILL